MYSMYYPLQDFNGHLPVSPWLAILGSFLLYHFVRAVYLIYLSPLSIFPGSKWAALGE